MARTDSEGNLLWERTYGEDHAAWGAALATTPDGGFVLAGNRHRPRAGGPDGWVVGTDSQGNLLWDSAIKGNGQETVRALVMLADGALALAGHLRPKGEEDARFWLVKTDHAGNLLWETTYVGAGYNHEANSLVSLLDGGFALVGTTEAEGDDGNDILLVRTGSECSY